MTHRGGITQNRYDLTQTVFTGGARYTPLWTRAWLRPFGDVLVGGAHAGGSLSPSNTGLGSAFAFAFQAGGGVQVPMRRWRGCCRLGKGVCDASFSIGLDGVVAGRIGAQATEAPQHIAREADLPRISYPVSATAQELLQMPKAQFLQFAAPVEADVQKIQAQYQIDDHATLAPMLETR